MDDRDLFSVSVLATAAVLFLLCGSARSADPVRIADFESGLPAGVARLGVNATVKPDGSGSHCLELTLPEKPDTPCHVTLPLPDGVNLARYRTLVARVRTVAGKAAIPLRWMALNAAGHVIFQRKFEFDGGMVWHALDWPLPLWRWGSSNTGDWSEVRSLRLRIESVEGRQVWIDDVALVPGDRGDASALPPRQWLTDMAFEKGTARIEECEGFLVGIDAPHVTDADIRFLLDRVCPIRPWLERLFGDAYRPVAEASPIAIFIFRNRDTYGTFFSKLGTSWRAGITPPKSGGYAVQDFATSFYDPSKGLRRPVYVHETVHAVAARSLRLLPGNMRHSWLQEGLANYVQLCLFPESLSRSTLVDQFNKPISKDGRTLFVPTRVLLTTRITGRHYAQLATLTAFLIEKQPDVLPVIARGLAAEERVDTLVARCGLSFDEIHDRWLAWGKARFAPDSKPGDGLAVHFDLPQEWSKCATADDRADGDEEAD